MVVLRSGTSLIFWAFFVFGAIDIINVHAHEESNDGARRSGRHKAENGGDDGELQFHAGLGLEKVGQGFKAIAQDDFLHGPQGGFIVCFGPEEGGFHGFWGAIAGFHGIGFSFVHGHGIDENGFLGLGGKGVFEDDHGGLGRYGFYLLGVAVDGGGFTGFAREGLLSSR